MKIEKGIQLIFFIMFLLVKQADSQTIITSCIDLISMSTGGNYQLGQDIDCSSNSFTPLGNLFSPFQVNLDGANHAIKNLSPSCSSGLCGIFSYLTLHDIQPQFHKRADIYCRIVCGIIGCLYYLFHNIQRQSHQHPHLH